MNDVITIGQLAQAADVPTSTIRYYEREGLLEPEGRTEGNYRFYGPHSLERLRFVKAAQALGFTLMDISMLLGFRDGKDDPCEEVQHIIEGRLDDLEKRLEDLQTVREVLSTYLSRCESGGDTGHCEVIDALTSTASPT